MLIKIKDKNKIQDFKVQEIILYDQPFLKGGTGTPPPTTETISSTEDPNHPSGYSDDCSNSGDNSTGHTGGNILKVKSKTMVD